MFRRCKVCNRYLITYNKSKKYCSQKCKSKAGVRRFRGKPEANTVKTVNFLREKRI